ncbi:MAG TPA: shikimate kinase [Acidobacteriaceae bacterium]|nr:shikimate kinase [Acidobacteriaceae bacterium]
MPPIVPKSHHSDDAHARASSIERLVLTGFMGSGKSTIGRHLAERLGWRFVDLDHLIEERDGRTVARIFAESGEPAFRAKETEALATSLHESRIIVALGGGALETPANRHALSTASRTCVVLLSAEFDTLFDRCQQQITSAATAALPIRPLLGDREAAAARLARREPIYREAADVILDTTGQLPEQSVEALLTILASIL